MFPGLYDYCRMVATGSLGCAARLNSGEARVAINWFGGMHHARPNTASCGCYVNDCVLAILELLKEHQRVMYVDLDRTHCDAVEEAFLTTDRVITLSLHSCPSRGEWTSTGHIDDIGVEKGAGCAINVPLLSGADDATFTAMFKRVFARAKKVFAPDAIVVQCGGGALAGERTSNFNVTLRGYGNCVKLVKDAACPCWRSAGAARASPTCLACGRT